MAYFGACAFVFVWIATTQPGKSLACERVTYQISKQKYLANHVIETKQAESEMECGLHCVKNKLCTSVNYQISGIGKGRCELNNKTVQETSDVVEKIHHPEFNHLTVIERVSTYILYNRAKYLKKLTTTVCFSQRESSGRNLPHFHHFSTTFSSHFYQFYQCPKSL